MSYARQLADEVLCGEPSKDMDATYLVLILERAYDAGLSASLKASDDVLAESSRQAERPGPLQGLPEVRHRHAEDPVILDFSKCKSVSDVDRVWKRQGPKLKRTIKAVRDAAAKTRETCQRLLTSTPTPRSPPAPQEGVGRREQG